MSSSARLNSLINDAYIKDCKYDALSAYKEYQLSHCYHPQKVRVYDAHLGIHRIIEVGCGKCYHCIESKVNEWVTRMYAHVEDFKNVYFVTLTYRSFTDDKLDVNRLMMSKLSQALWHLDSFNQSKHFSYNPCILCKSHYQNFLKRLRKLTGYNDITYCISGEYGKKFGRPHFHLILFSNHDITYEHIKRAWSIALFKHNSKGWSYKTNQLKDGLPFYFPIGKVDYHNLVTNGSFNTTERVKIDGNYFNAHNCFAYVCKYVCKQDSYNKKRLNIGFNSCFSKSLFVKIDNVEYTYRDAFNKYLSFGFNHKQIVNLFKFIKYEKVIENPVASLFTDGVILKTLQKLPFDGVGFPSISNEIITWLLPPDYYLFREKFAPFVEFSRGTPLGSVYAKNHIHEFAHGVFNKPILQVQSYVLPKYFVNKVSEFLYGLRKVSKSIKSLSYVKSNLIDLDRLFKECCDPTPIRYTITCSYSNEEDIAKIIKSDAAFFDAYTKEHIIFPCEKGVILTECYKYNRSLRKFVLTRRLDFNSFLHDWLFKLADEQRRYTKSLKDILISKSLFEQVSFKLLDMGLDITDLRINFEKEQNIYLNHRDNFYNDVHISVE